MAVEVLVWGQGFFSEVIKGFGIEGGRKGNVIDCLFASMRRSFCHFFSVGEKCCIIEMHQIQVMVAVAVFDPHALLLY